MTVDFCNISSHHDDLFESDQAIFNRQKRLLRKNDTIARPIAIGNKILCSSGIVHENFCWIIVGDASGVAHKVALFNGKSFDKTNGRILTKYKGHSGPVSSVAVHKDFVLTGSWDKSIRQFTHDGQCIKVYQGHGDYVKTILVYPTLVHKDEILFHSGGADGRCISWRACDYSSSRLFQRSIEQMIHYSYIEKTCVAVSSDGLVKILSMNSIPKEIATLKGHETSVYCACIDMERELLYTGSADKTIIAWDLQTFQLDFTIHCQDWIKSLEVDSTDGFLYAGTRDGYLLVIDPNSATILHSLDGHCDEITCIHVDHCQNDDGNSYPFVFTCSIDGTIRQWSRTDMISGLQETLQCRSLCTEEEEKILQELLK